MQPSENTMHPEVKDHVQHAKELQAEMINLAIKCVPIEQMGANGFANSILAKVQLDAMLLLLLEEDVKDRKGRLNELLTQILSDRIQGYRNLIASQPRIVSASAGKH